ncbi:PIN domain-containing protein [Sporichthya sp.]|uniref:PIN domain-containing protein n=1 Tax=Sporichthya sp. TaxID=65475 RepID=UPI0017DA0FD9|nr:PIN domain-containing protein [Sporichthya sp.]MBA3743834.1 VapC toxin family PIN domain ribonuclease [Sporichthya sp.]
MNVVLDAEAFSALAGQASIRKQKVRRILRTAQRLNRDVSVPSLVLAELYRGRGHNQLVDACLSRESPSLDTRDTDRDLARLVGGVLAAAGADSTLIVDAHVVAAAGESGGGVVVTGDEADLTRLAAPYPHIVVEPI